MANLDRPNGFRPVKTLSGAPVASLIRYVKPGTNDDLFIGDAITITGDGAQKFDTGAANCAGVIVGIGKNDTEGHKFPYSKEDLELKFFDVSVYDDTEYSIAYVPADDCLFEVQFDGTSDPVVGNDYDINATAGDTTTGRAQTEITSTSTNDDVTVVEIPIGGGYDQTSGVANKRVWVKFANVGL